MTFSRRPTQSVETRAIDVLDLAVVHELLDACMGRGYWDLDLRRAGSHRIATVDDRIVGIASASIVDAMRDAPQVCGPIGLVRLVAVDPHFRGRGIATRLVGEVCAECERKGAKSLAAFAWVHARTDTAPLAGILKQLGFTNERRIEGFYASLPAVDCPGCGTSPCVCAADLYVRG